MVRSSGTPVTLTGEDRKRLEGIMKNPQSLRKHAWRADTGPIPARASARRKRDAGPASRYRPSSGGGNVFLPRGSTGFRPTPRARRAGRRYPGSGQGPD